MEDLMSRKISEMPPYAQRHGSPDKVPASRFANLGASVEVVCPECDAVLRVDAAILSLEPEFDCAGCGAPIGPEQPYRAFGSR
jgi:hypothetical protein